jgi:hypothetical protein
VSGVRGANAWPAQYPNLHQEMVPALAGAFDMMYLPLREPPVTRRVRELAASAS